MPPWLKRGLAEDLVIAPYASAMALMVAPRESCENLQRLAGDGLAGEEHAATFAPIDVALEADIEAGAPIITEMMAKLQGYRLVRETEDVSETGLTHRDISILNAELGDVSRMAIEALDDGKIDARERKDLLSELADLKKQLAVVEGKLGGGV